MTDYARDIGINRKTLSAWVSVYKCVIEKLDVDLNEVSVKEWEIANKVHAILKNEKQAINASLGKERAKDKGWKIQTPASKIKDMFEKYKSGQRPIEAKIHSWTDTIIFIKNKLATENLHGVSVEGLMLLKKNIDQASYHVTEHLLEHRGMDIGELV